MEKRSFKDQIIAGFAWQSASRLIIQLFSWITTILVARILSPEDYGIVAIQGIFTVTVGMVVDMGVSRGLIQKDSVTDNEVDSLFYFALLSGLFFYGVYYLLAPLIAGFYDLPDLTAILRVAGLTFIFGSISSVPIALTMRRMDFRYRSLVEMGGAFVNTGSLLLMAMNGFGAWALILSTVIQYAVVMIGYFPILKRVPRPRLVFTEINEVIAFGLKIMLTRLMFSSYMKADILFLGKIGGEKVTGFYSMAFQLATIPLDKIGTIFNEVAFPAFSRVKNDPEQAAILFINLHKYLLILALPLLVGLSIVAEEFVLLVLGEKWEPIIFPLQVLALVNVLRLSGMIMIPVLQGLGLPNRVLRYSSWSTVLLPLAFYYGSHYGMLGIMFGWLLAFPLLYWYLVAEVLSALNITRAHFLKSSMPPITCTLLMLGGIFLFQTSTVITGGWLHFITTIVLGAVFYLGSYSAIFNNQIIEIIAGIKHFRTSSQIRQ